VDRLQDVLTAVEALPRQHHFSEDSISLPIIDFFHAHTALLDPCGVLRTLLTPPGDLGGGADCDVAVREAVSIATRAADAVAVISMFSFGNDLIAVTVSRLAAFLLVCNS
jgi:hypothetical protein